jgi:hypothetical protein
LRRAAEQGHGAAQNNLGVLYANGQGVPRNPVLAYVWYSLAAAGDNGKARFNRDQIVPELNSEQLVAGQRLAADYAERYRPASP